jgi:flagellar basal-body rod protein FlgB
MRAISACSAVKSVGIAILNVGRLLLTLCSPSTVKPALRRKRRENPAMDLNLSILRLASGLAAHSSARQSVIAENIAHADTPGYRARDVADFGTLVGDQAAFGARMTRPGHIPFGDDRGGFAAQEATALGAESPNGNTVSLEDQMMRAADVRQSHDLALGVYRKSLEILRTSLGRQR